MKRVWSSPGGRGRALGPQALAFPVFLSPGHQSTPLLAPGTPWKPCAASVGALRTGRQDRKFHPRPEGQLADPDVSTPGRFWGEERAWGVLQARDPWKPALRDLEPESSRVGAERAWTGAWAPPSPHLEDGVDTFSPPQGCCEPGLCAGGHRG